jgi:hypothetical protein
MKRICAWCTPPRFLGHVAPLDDDQETHVICPECAAKELRELRAKAQRERKGKYEEEVMYEEEIELLECAKVNCDNIAVVGNPMVDVVKLQIDMVIERLKER